MRAPTAPVPPPAAAASTAGAGVRPGAWLLAWAWALLAGCAFHTPDQPLSVGAPPGAYDPKAETEPPAGRNLERMVERRLSDARIFRSQGRLEAAERALRRALELDPRSAEAHRLLTRVLEDQGRLDEAARHRARAKLMEPPPPPLAETSLPVDGRGLVVVLSSPDPDAARSREVSERLPDPALALPVLSGRVQTRLPAAALVETPVSSVADGRARLEQHRARAALAVHVSRAYCGSSAKDGDFGVVWLEVASASPAGLASPRRTVRHVLSDPPRSREACLALALARALEEALEDSGVGHTLAASQGSGWPSPAVRALFPEIGVQLAAHVERGRARLATGRVDAAVEDFRRAVALDPDDLDARAYLREAEETQAMARALGPAPSAERGAAGGSALPFSLSEGQRTIAESLLSDEQRRRKRLLAAIAISEGNEPPPSAVDALRPVRLEPPPAPGPRLAKERSQADVEARALFTEDGQILTTYYFPLGGDRPLLREEDTDRDGRPDRWIGYRNDRRSDLWEDRVGAGGPDVHVRFDPIERVERIEIDANEDGRSDRVFQYEQGRLARDSRDTDGDAVLDRFDTFDAEGHVEVREEDLNGDGEIDIRSRYRGGKLVSREVTDPALVESLIRP